MTETLVAIFPTNQDNILFCFNCYLNYVYDLSSKTRKLQSAIGGNCRNHRDLLQLLILFIEDHYEEYFCFIDEVCQIKLNLQLCTRSKQIDSYVTVQQQNVDYYHRGSIVFGQCIFYLGGHQAALREKGYSFGLYSVHFI